MSSWLVRPADPDLLGALSEGLGISLTAARILASRGIGSVDEARRFFQDLVQVTRDWNRTPMEADEFKQIEEKIEKAVAGVTRYV